MRAPFFKKPKHRKSRSFVATAGATLAVVGIVTASVVVPAVSASATHPAVNGVAVCNTSTGLYDITWRVAGDTGYPNETATIVTQSIATSPTMVEKTVKNTSYVEGVQTGVPAGTYTQVVQVQWTNHSKGDLVSQTGTVKTTGNCTVPPPEDNTGTKITICHATASNTNPYTNPTVDYNSIISSNGHGSHNGDIIPPFNYIKQGVPGSFPGLNWDSGTSQAFIDRGCAPPPFNYDWQYAAPTCTALTVVYPADIPAGQANDVNIRFLIDGKQVTLNFHNNTGTWSGTHAFVYADHPDWPDPDEYTVLWTQVGGTNYHWEGEVKCGEKPTPLVAAASVVKADSTCLVAETASADGVANATLFSSTGTTGPGQYEFVFKAVTNALFPAGPGVSSDRLTKTITGTLAGALDTPSCHPVIVVDASIKGEACYYNAEQNLSFKPIYLTYNNEDSNVPVLFTVSAPYGDLSRTVPAGESVTVRAQDGWQNGVGYQVTANGKVFNLEVKAFEGCGPKPPDEITFSDGKPVAVCLPGDVKPATVTFERITTTVKFDKWDGSKWIAGTTIVSDPVTITIPTPEGLKLECPPTLIDTPPAPGASGATCFKDGALPALPVGEHFVAKWDSTKTGPGDYVQTITANTGYFFGKDLTVVTYPVHVPAKLTGGLCVPMLALTGSNPFGPAFVAWLLIVAGLTLGGIALVRRRKSATS